MKKKKLKDDYKNQITAYHPQPQYFLNSVRAFITGGFVCTFGQAVTKFYKYYFQSTDTNASNLMIVTLILITILFTGFGVYDNFAQFAGAGSIVLFTGFANAMASAAIEHRSEGIVLGVGANMFKLAGGVIVFGVVAAYMIGFIRYTLQFLI
ncbi:stage V sporulation protein AC [Microbacteriaceae bacterium 4G12]